MKTAVLLLLLSALGCGTNLTLSDQQEQAQRERCLQICQVRGPLSAADAEVMPICERKIEKCRP